MIGRVNKEPTIVLEMSKEEARIIISWYENMSSTHTTDKGAELCDDIEQLLLIAEGS